MSLRFLPAVAATVLTAGVLSIPALAQDNATEEPTTTESTNPGDMSREERQAEMQERRAEMQSRHDELLAGELGVSVDELQAAQDSVRTTMKAERRVELEAMLAQAVENGRITQEEADAKLEAFDNGEFAKGPRGRGGEGRGGEGRGGEGRGGEGRGGEGRGGEGRRGPGQHGDHGPRSGADTGDETAEGTAA